MATRDKIFVSYSHLDPRPFEEFKSMMAPAIQQDVVDLWDDTRIPPGALWKQEIERALASARIAVLLVSRHFLASRFIAQYELPPLLTAAREEGVTVFWIYLSSCLYEQTAIASYQAAHDVSKPLDQLPKAKREALLSEICFNLIQAARNAIPPAQPTQPQAVDKGLHCFVLIAEALQTEYWASGGGGPSTALHRRLDLAKAWVEQGAALLRDCRGELEPGLADDLDQASIQTLPLLLAEARLALPPSGETDKKSEDSDYFQDARESARDLLQRIEKHLAGNADYGAVWNSQRKWAILGFRDDKDLDDYLYPPVSRLGKSADPMQRDLFERLLQSNEFTPRQLSDEGYRKELVMDTVNALMKEKWAEWTDLTRLGADGKGRVTEVGKRLLKRFLESAQAATIPSGGPRPG